MKAIRFERHESVGHIVLANPPSNLIATDFSDCLRDAVHEASETDIRALLIRAEGPNFSQGGDVLDFIDKDFNSWRTFISEIHLAYRPLERVRGFLGLSDRYFFVIFAARAFPPFNLTYAENSWVVGVWSLS